MPRNHQRPPGRGIRRPQRNPQKEKDIQAFVEGKPSDVRDVSDVSNISNIQASAKVTPMPQRPKPVVAPEPEAQAPAAQATPYASDVVRNDGRKLRRTTLYLKPELHERLKKAARLTGCDNSTLVNDLLEAHLQTLIKDAINNL